MQLPSPYHVHSLHALKAYIGTLFSFFPYYHHPLKFIVQCLSSKSAAPLQIIIRNLPDEADYDIRLSDNTRFSTRTLYRVNLQCLIQTVDEIPFQLAPITG